MPDRLSIQAQRDASFSPCDESKKGVGSFAMILLMLRRFRRLEPHDCEELDEELGAEMPPRVPDEVLRRRCQSRYRRAFQVWMEFVYDDECLCSFSALLNDPKRVATVE